MTTEFVTQASAEQPQLPFYSHHREALLHRITTRIRQSIELQEILQTTVAEVQAFLQTDRVKIYRFHADGSGEVIAEALREDHLPPLIGLNFPADDIPPYARELFIKARQRVVVDVIAQTTTALSLTNQLEVCELEPLEDIRYRPVDPCHVEYLLAMGVKSSVVVPILHQDRLWGLLVSHHSEQRNVTEEELRLIGSVADQVEVAIAQSILLAQVREQAEQEAKINQFTTLLHQNSAVQPQVALEAIVNLLQASGGRLHFVTETEDKFYTVGEQPTTLLNSEHRQIEQHRMWQQYLQFPNQAICRVEAEQDSGQEPWSARWMQSVYRPQGERPDSHCWAIHDIYQEPLFRTLVPSFQGTAIRGVMIVPLRRGDRTLGCLTLFRNEVETERVWADWRTQDPRQRMAQQSFAAWCELKRGQSQPWTDMERKLTMALATHLCMAIQQDRLYQQVQSLNANLEQQVHERTAELQQLLEQQQALFHGIAKIRASLELDAIFQTTAQEVYHLLQVDRSVIYQFHEDWSGHFIAEAVGQEWVGLYQQQTCDTHIQTYASQSDRCIINSFLKDPVPDIDAYLQETQGGAYRQGCTLKQVDDIYQMNFSTCYLQVLESFQCRAYLIVPIFQGDRLWGLLAVYQNTGPRQWKAPEKQLMMQTAVQLGVAIQQAELFNQTQAQAQQMAQMVNDLKQAQSQLIQTEKMSSLGQLVAGVAHEINNPINFVHGNLNPAMEYIREVFGVLELYRQRVPEPDIELKQRMEAIDFDFITADLPKLLASMRVGTERIQEIVRSLRHFSRIDEAEFKAVNLHDGIDSTLMILKHRLKAQPNRPEIQIQKHYESLPPVECYAGQLNQVLMNLISNAIDALEERDSDRLLEEIQANPSVIHIHTRLINETWTAIHIADNGPGMSEAVRSHLFDPFFTTKPVGKGTGLGLAISYRIVTERHGGRLSCHSTPGQGAEFVIEIPIRYQNQQKTTAL